MKILEIIPQLHMGGAEHFTVNLCNEFAKMGHEVTLVVTNSIQKYGYFAQFLDNKVKLICLNKKQGADIKLFYHLARLIKKESPDIVHTHLGAVVYTILSSLTNKHSKFFHTIHNAADKEATTGGRISALARKIQFFNQSVTPITISEESLISFKNFYGSKPRPKLIYNGVPKKKANPETVTEIDTSTPTLINVARVMPQKNQIELVKAIEEINNEGKRVKLYILGPNDTAEGDQIRNMQPKYTFLLGPKANPIDYIAAGDAFILSSIYEGMPLTLIESMSVGKMAICTPVGGIINMVVDGHNGILTAGTTKADLKEGILRFLELTDNEKEKYNQYALESFSKYSIEKCASEYLKIFNECL